MMLKSLFYRLLISIQLIFLLYNYDYQCYELSEQLFIKQLLSNYEIASRPIQYGNETLNIFLCIILKQIIDLDEKNQILHTSLLIQLKWIDETIQLRMLQLYDLYHRNNTTNKLKTYFPSLVLPSSRIWTPDLYVYNNADDGKNGLLDVSHSRVRISQKGKRFW